MNSSDSQDILNRIVYLFRDFVKLDVQGFDISEEKTLYIDSILVFVDKCYESGIAVKYNLYLMEPVYVLILISEGALYEIAEKMKVDVDPDIERVRDDENALSFIIEIANMMTASVADRYAKRLNNRVLYSPPRVVRYIMGPKLIDGIDIRSRQAKMIIYEFLFSRPESAIKLFIIY